MRLGILRHSLEPIVHVVLHVAVEQGIAGGIRHKLHLTGAIARYAGLRQKGRANGGGRGIRTPERVTPLTVFKTAAFNHSAIPP